MSGEGEKLLPCFECQGAGWVEYVEPGCCGNFSPHGDCRRNLFEQRDRILFALKDSEREAIAEIGEAAFVSISAHDHMWIYFVDHPREPLIKIGRTRKLQKRMAALAAGVVAKGPLTLIGRLHGPAALEQEFHQMFISARRHGEWFDATPKLRAYAERFADV